MKLGLICLIASSSGIKFRPISSESAPWEKIAITAGMLKPDFPIDYVVPSYGVDQDIINTESNLKLTEKNLGKKLHADFDQTSNPVNPRNYRNVNANNKLDADVQWTEDELKALEE